MTTTPISAALLMSLHFLSHGYVTKLHLATSMYFYLLIVARTARWSLHRPSQPKLSPPSTQLSMTAYCVAFHPPRASLLPTSAPSMMKSIRLTSSLPGAEKPVYVFFGPYGALCAAYLPLTRVARCVYVSRKENESFLFGSGFCDTIFL